jgi:hypothetical protein
MKIRILDDNVRLRLARSEVECIASGRAVEASTRFPGGGRFRYALEVGGGEMTAAFRVGSLVISVPPATAQHWAATDSEVSIRGSLPLDDGALGILIEKDFECLEPRPGEDAKDRFPNPNARRDASGD